MCACSKSHSVPLIFQTSMHAHVSVCDSNLARFAQTSVPLQSCNRYVMAVLDSTWREEVYEGTCYDSVYIHVCILCTRNSYNYRPLIPRGCPAYIIIMYMYVTLCTLNDSASFLSDFVHVHAAILQLTTTQSTGVPKTTGM